MGFKEFSYRTFKSWIKVRKDRFKEMDPALKKSGLDYSLEEYLSLAFMTCSIVFVVSLTISILITMFFMEPIFAIAMSILLSVAVTGIIFFIFYIWPTQVVSDKEKRIDNTLHYVITYMSTLAGAGTPPHAIFKALGKFKEFGEISKVIQRINRDMELFGLELTESIQKVSVKIPSESFKDFLLGLRTVITTGGDLKSYLEEKSDTFLDDHRRRIEEYGKNLSILLEIYITVVIVGSIFALILSTVLGLFAGAEMNIQSIQLLLMFLVLPGVIAIFIVIIRSISPMRG